MNNTYPLESQARDNAEAVARRWIVIALVYFVGSVALGVVMGASHDFRLKAVHVHGNLLGWVSMVLMGLIYRLYPMAAASRLARWHFALYQLTLPVMLGALAALMLGRAAAAPVVGVTSVVMLAAVLCFALAVVTSGRRSLVGVNQPQAAT